MDSAEERAEDEVVDWVGGKAAELAVDLAGDAAADWVGETAVAAD